MGTVPFAECVMNRFLAIVAMLSILGACSLVPKQDPPLVEQPFSMRPVQPQLEPASPGSLVPRSALGVSTGYRPLFEDRRPRHVGDVLTVAINERTQASNRQGSNLSRSASVSTGISTATKVPFGKAMQGIGLEGQGDSGSQSKGENTADNAFVGTISVTVIEVLPNGNLRVAGEKGIAIRSTEEFVRFTGVVNPVLIPPNNTISSTQIADVRLEYKGRGTTANAMEPGWFMSALFRILPF